MDRDEYEDLEHVRLHRLGETLAAAAEEVLGVVRDELTLDACRDELQGIVDRLEWFAKYYADRSHDLHPPKVF